MKCPKCGHDNNPDIIFCEECDWRLDIPYRPEKKRNPAAYSAVTVVLGIVAAACGFLGQHYVAVIAGAVAMLLGGYSMNLPRLLGVPNATQCMAISALGLILGVVGFILGFSGALGA